MPRPTKKETSPAVKQERRLIWEQTGSYGFATVGDFDPKSQMLADALLYVVSTGATVVLRPGSGNRSLGIAIWEGDVRHAPKWVYDAEELDEWSLSIIQVKQAAEAEAAD